MTKHQRLKIHFSISRWPSTRKTFLPALFWRYLSHFLITIIFFIKIFNTEKFNKFYSNLTTLISCYEWSRNKYSEFYFVPSICANNNYKRNVVLLEGFSEWPRYSILLTAILHLLRMQNDKTSILEPEKLFTYLKQATRNWVEIGIQSESEPSSSMRQQPQCPQWQSILKRTRASGSATSVSYSCLRHS